MKTFSYLSLLIFISIMAFTTCTKEPLLEFDEYEHTTETAYEIPFYMEEGNYKFDGGKFPLAIDNLICINGGEQLIAINPRTGLSDEFYQDLYRIKWRKGNEVIGDEPQLNGCLCGFTVRLEAKNLTNRKIGKAHYDLPKCETFVAK